METRTLTDDERELGVLLVDIGSGGTEFGGDSLSGGTGNDIMITGDAPMNPEGGLANLDALTPKDILNAGNDLEDDTVFGGDGHDTFYAGFGRDLLVSGSNASAIVV